MARTHRTLGRPLSRASPQRRLHAVKTLYLKDPTPAEVAGVRHVHARNAGRVLLVVAGCGALSACGYGVGFSDYARTQFVGDYTCPADRVEVVRTNVRASSVLLPSARQPPSEVAMDPVRLREWNRQRDEERSDTDYQWKVFDVTGCGHSARYACAGYLPGDTWNCKRPIR